MSTQQTSVSGAGGAVPLTRAPHGALTGYSASSVAAGAERIRGLSRRLARADMIASRGKLHFWISRLKKPARVTRDTMNAVRQYGRQAEADTGVSRATQFARLWWLDLRHHFNPENAYRLQLFRPERWRTAPAYVQMHEANLVYRLACSHGAIDATETLSDKRRFAEWCRQAGIPTAANLMEFEDGCIQQGSESGSELPEASLFAKWAASFGGSDTMRYDYADGRFHDAGGSAYDSSELVADLASRSRGSAVVLQRCLVNHPAFAGLTTRALSTIRIMTYRRPGRPAGFLLGVMRMGTGDSTADNYAQGGIASAVDPATGEIGPAIRLDEELRSQSFDTHPDTGATIVGFRIPFWKEVRDLPLKAHDLLGDVPCIGWDVAVLESGPVLLEGNWNPCVKLAQVPTSTPLLATPFADAICDVLALYVDATDDMIRAGSTWEPEPVRRHKPAIS